MDKNSDQKDRGKASVGLFEEYAKEFRDLCRTWIENLFSQTVKPRLRNLFGDAYAGVKYLIGEEEYAEQENLFLNRFVGGIEKILKLYKVD